MTTTLQQVRGMMRPPHGPVLRALSQIRECGCCGLVQRLPPMEPGSVAHCTRCDAMLGRRYTNPPIATPLAFCLSSLVLYLICISQPLMTLSIYGRMREITLFTGPIELMRDGWIMAGILVGLVTAVIPFLEILLMLGILLGALHHRLPWRVPRMMRWYDRLRPWSMVEVYLLGLLVAYTKMIDLADVTVGTTAFALFGLMMTMAATDSTLDDDVIWSQRRVRLVHRCLARQGDAAWEHTGQEHADQEHADREHADREHADREHVGQDRGNAEDPARRPIEVVRHLPPLDHMVSCRSCELVCYSEAPLDPQQCVGACPRCGQRLHRRKPDGLRRCMVFVFCAIILYIPANVFPVMTTIKLHRGGDHTILQGVRELYEAKMLPLALLVFFASITVPVLKILSLCAMSLATWRRSSRCLLDRTRLYRIVELIGRWSMIDVFMISILVAMVHFGQLANVNADGGMLAFAAVVILTILGSSSFDPRVMWDAAGLNGAALARQVPARFRIAEPAQA